MEYDINENPIANTLYTTSLGYKEDSTEGWGTAQTHCSDPVNNEVTDKNGLHHVHSTFGTVWIKVKSPDMEVNN